MHRTASNETTPISDIVNIINEENLIIAVLTLGDKFCEEQALPYILPMGKF